ncbi:response regulator [Sediminicoccus sp. KRV36]|uniref:response regulator n=1 Tax=Sediminicoccus sp. KRV36 TaxID=3133721 RepID=UPI00200D6206|nr:response regulator [Sediminicoccus rosea]UPY38795.1 response regulator [Sediminicoccus rosea]
MATTSDTLALLPFARRYARALLGTQAAGDAVVARAIGMRLDDVPPQLALYAAITRLTAEDGTAGAIPPLSRHLLLLTAVEELSLADAAMAVGLDPAEADRRITFAREAVRSAVVTKVLIIEDEPIIAMDLRMLVEDCGHTVIGVAATEADAVRLAAEHSAGLILADINLGRGGNGINAVRQILTRMEVPVIFVTAYPEDLLTAEGLEPAFVMRKPFDRFMLAVFTYQAISGGYVPLP